MMGHRMSFIRRPSSFLLIPVGSPGRDLHFVRLPRLAVALWAQRSDVGCDVAGFGPAQGKVRHLRMRVEQEEGEPLWAEIWPACNGCEGGDVDARLALTVRHDVAGRAPAL